MTEEKNPAQTPAQDLTQNQVENPTPAQTQPAPAAAPAKPTMPLPDCTDRDCRFAALLFVLCLFAANCTALCRTGIGYALSTLLLAGASLVYLRRELRWNALNVLCLAACVLVTASSAVFGETAMTPYKMLFAWLSGALFLVSATGAGASMLDDFRAAFAPLLLFLGGSCPTVGITARAFAAKRKEGKRFLSVFLGLLIAVPTVLVLGLFLQSADAAFAAVVSQLRFDRMDVFLTLLFGVMLFVFFFPLLFARQKKLQWEETDRTIESVPLLDSAFVTTVLAAVSAMYVVFLVSQLSYLVGGFAGVRPEELTFAAYARRGFGEMCVVCVLNLGLLFLARLFVRRKDGRLPRTVRAATVFISAFSAFLIAAAIAKMFLYMRTYGLTFLRLSTSVFMFFLLFVFVAVSVKCFVPQFRHIRAILAVGCVLAVLCSAADLGAVTVQYNLHAYESGMHEQIDVDYLHTCGDVAVPALVKLSGDADETVRAEALSALKALRRHRGDWRSASVASLRADRLFEANKAQIDAAADRAWDRPY